MNKEQLVALGLSEEQATQVLEGFKGYVPPARFNEVNEAKKNAEALVTERDKQLTTLKKSVGDNEELKKQIETLQAENKAAQTKYEADLKAIQLNNAVEQALLTNGAKNVKAVRALLDMEKVKFEADKLEGLEEQINALREAEDSKFMFNDVNVEPTGMKRDNPPQVKQQKTVAEMSYSEMMAHIANGGTLD